MQNLIVRFRWVFNPVILRIILWANHLFFRRRAILTTKSIQQAKTTECKEETLYEQRTVLCSLVFSAFILQTFVFSPVFTPWKMNGWNLQITHLERKNDLNQTSMRTCAKCESSRGVSFRCFQRFVYLLVSASEPSGQKGHPLFGPPAVASIAPVDVGGADRPTWTYITLGVGTSLSQ